MWIKALNGNVLEVPDDLVPSLVEQGHEAFTSESEARGVKPPPVKPKPSRTKN